MKILILFSASDKKDTPIENLARSYSQIWKEQGHTVLAENTFPYQYSDEVFPKLEQFCPDFGVTLNLAGFNLLTTGEDSLLTKFLCPFAHEIVMPPYYLNQYLDSRFIFNHIVYCHSVSHAEYIRNFFPDVPDIQYCPLPQTLSNNMVSHSPDRILSEIRSLPEVFANLCHSLIDDLQTQPDLIFSEFVLSKMAQLGIDNMTAEEQKDLITMCSLSEEYVCSISKMPPDQIMSDEQTTDLFLQRANFPSSIYKSCQL